MIGRLKRVTPSLPVRRRFEQDKVLNPRRCDGTNAQRLLTLGLHFKKSSQGYPAIAVSTDPLEQLGRVRRPLRWAGSAGLSDWVSFRRAAGHKKTATAKQTLSKLVMRDLQTSEVHIMPGLRLSSRDGCEFSVAEGWGLALLRGGEKYNRLSGKGKGVRKEAKTHYLDPSYLSSRRTSTGP